MTRHHLFWEWPSVGWRLANCNFKRRFQIAGERKRLYPFKEIGLVLWKIWPCVEPAANELKQHHAKAEDICLLRQLP